jgi:phosphoglycolate phosphatase/putative hydrolase of the HAD superfamily
MDLTLYTNPEYGQYQIDSLVKKIAGRRGLSFEEMSRELDEKRGAWALSHGGNKPSLSNLLTACYGVSMEENISWRKEIYEPEKFIRKDARLAEALALLSRSFAMGVVTNNPVSVARKTLAVLGVSELLPFIVGLDTCMIPKPHRLPFEKFSGLAGCHPETCVSVGDRYDVDLAIPLEMGMGAVLVDGAEDVYELPELLEEHIKGGGDGV